MLRLSRAHHRRAVNDTLQAAVLGLHHASSIHYSEDSRRWQGIDRHRVASSGQYPNWADCSAFLTWCLWNGLHVHLGHSDVVNGENWRGGFTGTLMTHGARVPGPAPGDAVLYGSGYPCAHTALYTGGGLVVSHGSEAGPLLLPVHYRGDVFEYRRYFTT